MIAYDALPRTHRLAGRYVIEGPLGRGRSSVVYKALDVETETRVALKVLDPLLAHDAVAAERFVREAQILRSLNHPNVIKVYALLADGNWSVISMEYFEGADGKSYLERNGRMSIGDFLRVAQRLTSALDACHRLKVVHRDLKPQNILINERCDVKIVDFGISKMNTMSDLTRTGTVFGTPQYLAPELFRSSRADPRSDIYALGATYYEFLTGRPPYPAMSLGAVLTQQLRGEIEPLSSFRDDVPRWLSAVIFKCLRTDPAQRYQSCYELRCDLERGEQAYVTYETDAAVIPCIVCQTPLLPGLPFCHHCGTCRELVIERGWKCLTLARCDSVDALTNFLTAQFPRVPRTRLAAALSRRPAVLFRGINARTATSLLHQLSVFPCELQVADHFGSAMKVPGAYVLLAVALVLPLFWMADKVSALTRLAIILAAELVVLALYWFRAQPAIPLATLRERRATSRHDAVVSDMADQLKRVSDPNVRMILAQIVRSYLTIRQRLARSTAPIRPEVIERSVHTALAMAPRLQRQEECLSGVSPNDLQGRIRAVDAELRRVDDTAKSAALIQLKTKLARDLSNFQTIQEAHASTYLGVLNLQAVLRRMEDAAQDTRAGAGILAELRGVEEDLQQLSATSGGELDVA